MKSISYNIICEDISHLTFIEKFLEFVSASNAKAKFSLNLECFWKWKFTNKSQVLENYAEVSARSVKEYGVSLVFVVTDFDDWDTTMFTSYHDDLHGGLQEDVKDRVLILLPVRAIEYWLWHLKWKKDNPTATKNEQIENRKRDELKKEIYGTKKPYRELSENKVREIMVDFYPDWLCSRSPSFNHFYTNFKKLS